MGLFTSKRKKQEQLELEKFKVIVKQLIDGIYKLDEIAERIVLTRLFRYDSVGLIMRSIQELIGLGNLYKKNQYFHPRYDAALTSALSSLLDVYMKLDDEQQKMEWLIIRVQKGKQMINADKVPDEDLYEFNELMGDLSQEIENKILKMYDQILLLRSIILSIRMMITQDYIDIVSGVDIIDMYHYMDSKIKSNIRYEVRFDKYEIKRFKKEEHTNG